jgi:deoxyadenosine/deoxycytidine kinase
MTVTFYSIEGNIGSGKSTLISRLKENNNSFLFLPEPIDVWDEIKDSSGVTVLEKYYEDNKRYAFSFQMMAYISRLSQIRKAIKSGIQVIVSERCVFTDYYVFAKMLYDSSKISEIDYLIYKKWFDEFIDDVPQPNIIYIRASPETCLKRVVKRNRKGESIPLEYLKMCHDYHEDWLSNIENVFIIDGENEIDISTLKIKGI